MAHLLKASSGHLLKKPSGHLAKTPNWPPAELIVGWSGYVTWNSTSADHLVTGSPQSCFASDPFLVSGLFDNNDFIRISKDATNYLVSFIWDIPGPSDPILVRFIRALGGGYIGAYTLDFANAGLSYNGVSAVSVSNP